MKKFILDYFELVATYMYQQKNVSQSYLGVVVEITLTHRVTLSSSIWSSH